MGALSSESGRQNPFTAGLSACEYQLARPFSASSYILANVNTGCFFTKYCHRDIFILTSQNVSPQHITTPKVNIDRASLFSIAAIFKKKH